MDKIPYEQLKVLLVDPQRPFQVMMKGILANFGVKKIELAENGEMAVRMCRSQPFNLLLVEYNLGTSKNGRQLLEELRALRLIKPDALFIVISGETNRAAVLGTMEMQPDDYIIKPFSQRLLDNRLQKAWLKRHVMSPIYYCLQKNEPKRAIQECKKLIKDKNRYRSFCIQMMTELLCDVKEYKEAALVLEAILKERDLVWAKINLARAYLGLGELEQSHTLLKSVLTKQTNNVEATDLLAQNLLKSGNSKLAQETLQRSISISPNSMKRHHQMINIATVNNDYIAIKDCYSKLLLLSRRSVHAGTDKLCDYLRSIIVAVKHSADKNDIYRLQSEITNTLQRAKPEEGRHLNYHFSIFEGIIQAQLHSTKGEHLKAKKILMEAISSFCDDDDKWDLPDDLAADVCLTLIEIDDLDLAKKFSKQVPENWPIRTKIDAQLAQAQNGERLQQFNKITKAGIEAYTKQNNLEALERFKEAIVLAPVNSGAALNLLQVQIVLMQQHKKHVKSLMSESKETLRLINGVKLNGTHKKRYTKIKRDFDELLRKHKA